GKGFGEDARFLEGALHRVRLSNSTGFRSLDEEFARAAGAAVRVCGVRRLAAILLLVGAGSGPARAADPPPAEPAPTSGGFDVEFGGGALIPTGPLADDASGSLDVGGRFGWSSRVGLGFVLAVDYAPLRQRAQRVDENTDVHLFSGSLSPRFVVGKSFV